VVLSRKKAEMLYVLYYNSEYWTCDSTQIWFRKEIISNSSLGKEACLLFYFCRWGRPGEMALPWAEGEI